MPSMQNAVNNHEYRSVPITALAESPTNPRKRFDAKSLEELAAYVPGHISGLCVVDDFVAEDSRRRTGTGGARAERHITITGSRAISAVPHLCASHHFGAMSPKLRREEGRLQPRHLSSQRDFRIAVGRF